MLGVDGQEKKMNRDFIHSNGYLSGCVQRWHTWPTIHKPNVAEHQCRVAQIYCELWGLPRAEVLYYCINHDRGEQFAGDVPFGGKNRVSGFQELLHAAEELGLSRQKIELPELSTTEYRRFKICDLLEMIEFCVHELNMGNTYMTVPKKDLTKLVLDYAAMLCDSLRVTNWMRGLQP